MGITYFAQYSIYSYLTDCQAGLQRTHDEEQEQVPLTCNVLCFVTAEIMSLSFCLFSLNTGGTPVLLTNGL